jgi:hypothetical protein
MRADTLSLRLTFLVAAIGLLPTALYVSPLFAILLVAVLVASAYQDTVGRYPLAGWPLNVLAVLGVVLAMLIPAPSGPLGRLLGAAVILMSAKLLAPKKPRDQLQVLLLGLLLIIGAAILSVSIGFMLLFVAYLVLCVFSLVWMPFAASLGSQPVPRRLANRISKVAAGLLVGSLPLVVLFFVALPRTTLPLWRTASPLSTGVSGFSDQISLGAVQQIVLNGEVAFRAELGSQPGPLAGTPYWRGLVFADSLDGVLWSKQTYQASYALPANLDGAVGQTIYLEPTGNLTLFGLDRPLALREAQDTTAAGANNLLQATQPVNRRLRYTVFSDPSPVSAQPLDAQNRSRYLAMPRNLPASVPQLARSIVGGEIDPARKVALLVDHFRTGGYTYSLQTAAGPGNALERFLLVTKTGYCEYYASGLTVMLRAVGVPARVIAGYLGGDYNSTGNYYLVRQSTAHTWVEAYLDGQGWVRLDATPQGDGQPSPVASSPASRTFLLLDALRLKWYALVIGYDFSQQSALLHSLNRGLHEVIAAVRGGVAFAAGGLALLAAAVLGILLARRRRSRTRRPSLERMHDRVDRRLRRRGIERRPGEGPRDFADRAGATLATERAVALREFSTAYLDWKYADRNPSTAELRRLRQRLRRI